MRNCKDVLTCSYKYPLQLSHNIKHEIHSEGDKIKRVNAHSSFEIISIFVVSMGRSTLIGTRVDRCTASNWRRRVSN